MENRKHGKSQIARIAKLSAVALLTLLLALDFSPTQAQRRGGGGGSFGGGRSSGGGFGRSGGFGGGFGSGRSSGRTSGGSFGGGSSGYSNSGRSSGGSFGGGSGYSSGGRAPSPGASFGRKGSFGSSGIVSSTTTRPSYYNQTPLVTRNYFYNGMEYPAYYYGGWGSRYSYAWGSPAWYYYTPFHPAFYYSPPMLYGGVMYPGSFSFTHLIFSLVFFVVVLWIVSRLLFRRGGGVRYTTYN